MKWIFILFIFSLAIPAEAEIYIDSTYTTISRFNESDWQNITKDHEYQQPKTFARNKTSTFSSPTWLKYATYTIAIILLAFLIYKLIVSLTTPSNKKVTAVNEYSEIPEEELSFENTDMDKTPTTDVRSVTVI
jgi:flagellar biosynthesis/type III secretory pathway M-ring protein FliF/YscJ